MRRLARRGSAFLQVFGLRSAEQRAWAMYDWANSAFFTTVVAAVYPIFYSDVVCKDLAPASATARFAVVTFLSMTVAGLAGPFCGALADMLPWKKRLLLTTTLAGSAFTAAMSMLDAGDHLHADALFFLANIAASMSLVFYDSLLPHVASDEELDRVSSAGYALGYCGGGLLLLLNLAWIETPEVFGISPSDPVLPVRLSFLSVALWWIVFSRPLFKKVGEPAVRYDEPIAGRAATIIGGTAKRLSRTWLELSRFRSAALMLGAFVLYNDGIGTVMRMATIYGAEIGIERRVMIMSLVIVQLAGIPCSFAFGALSARVPAKSLIMFSLVVYTGVVLLAHRMETGNDFLLLALLVATVQGGSQALSRSLFASFVPRDRSAEFFAFFSFAEKLAGVLGPLFLAIAIPIVGGTRDAILTIIPFFLAGGALLAAVDVEDGRQSRAIREE